MGASAALIEHFGTPVMVALITGISAYAAGQKNGKAAFVTAVHEAANLVIHNVTEECKRLDRVVIDLRAEHATCQAQLTGMQEQIDAMMSGPVPDYTTIKRPIP